MRAGQLKHSVTIEQATEAISAGGAVSRTWSTFAAVRAAIEPRTGREYSAMFQQFADLSVMFTVRGGIDINEKMRIVHDGRYFDILSIEGVDGKTPQNASELRIACRETQEQMT